MAQSVQVQKVNWWHERLADEMIAHPEMKLGEIARKLNRSQTWVSIVKNSDTFKDYWARRSAGHSEAVTQDIKDKGFAAAELALDHLNQKLESQGELMPVETLLNVIDTTMKRFNYQGAQQQAPTFNFNIGTVTADQLAAARARLRRVDEPIEVKALPVPPTSGEPE